MLFPSGSRLVFAAGLTSFAVAIGAVGAYGQEGEFGCMIMGEPCDPLAMPEAPVPPVDPQVDMGHARQTFEQVCSGCHALTMVEGYDKSREGWWTSIQMMIPYGLAATDAQQAEVLEYLASSGRTSRQSTR